MTASCKLCGNTRLKAKGYCHRCYDMHNLGRTDDDIRARLADPDYQLRSDAQKGSRRPSAEGGRRYTCESCGKSYILDSHGSTRRCKTCREAKIAAKKQLSADERQEGINKAARASEDARRKRAESDPLLLARMMRGALL